MHGGGFIAQTSKSHQSYLRQWSRNLNMPIFSVDYSLAPQAPFPRWDHNIHDMCTYVSMTVPNISTYHYFCSITEKKSYTSLLWIVDSATYDELITWFHEFFETMNLQIWIKLCFTKKIFRIIVSEFAISVQASNKGEDWKKVSVLPCANMYHINLYDKNGHLIEHCSLK